MFSLLFVPYNFDNSAFFYKWTQESQVLYKLDKLCVGWILPHFSFCEYMCKMRKTMTSAPLKVKMDTSKVTILRQNLFSVKSWKSSKIDESKKFMPFEVTIIQKALTLELFMQWKPFEKQPNYLSFWKLLTMKFFPFNSIQHFFKCMSCSISCFDLLMTI